MERVRPFEPTVHHSSNPEKTIPAESSIHQIPLDNTLMTTADDFLLFEPVLADELEVRSRARWRHGGVNSKLS